MTNIGEAHMEQLGSKENILKEKLCIQEKMAEDGALFLNGDDPLLRTVVPENSRKKILYGLSEGCDCRGSIFIWKPGILYLPPSLDRSRFRYA